jgi:hypothetical protein
LRQISRFAMTYPYITWHYLEICPIDLSGSASFRHRHCQVAIDWYTSFRHRHSPSGHRLIYLPSLFWSFT